MSPVLATVLTLTIVLQAVCAVPAFFEDEEDIGSQDIDKRRYHRPVPFPCNGYDNLPRCLHGGKGPRKTWTKSGRFCVCLCPKSWIGPECGYYADTLNDTGYKN